MTVLTDRDRAIVAAAIARATRPKGVLAERASSVETDVPAGGSTARRRTAHPARSASTFTGLCSFCGAPTLHSVACVAHSDLPALDCRTSAVVTTNTNGTRRTTIPGSAAGASQEHHGTRI